MKKIIAIVQIKKVSATKHALIGAGYPAFIVRRVIGRGKGNVAFRANSGAAEAVAPSPHDGPMLIPKRMVTLVVPDAAAPEIVRLLIATNQTGSKGDGKIFVQNVEEAVRIHTGERDEGALSLSQG